ncbi:MAG: hypothetical protein ACPL8I_15205 [Chloroflexaceae bacterium]
MSSAGHTQRAQDAGALGALLLAASSILLNHLLAGLRASLPAGIEGGVGRPPLFVWLAAASTGGTACLRRLALRLALWRAGVAPEYATMRRIAG